MLRPRIFFILLGVLCAIGFAEASRADTFYSVHLASYQSLENANRHVNQLKHHRDVVFWRETDIPEKGRFYRVYVGRFPHRSEAVEFWNQLNTEGSVTYFGVHQFTEPITDTTEFAAAARLPAPPSEKESISGEPRRDGRRFLDNRDGTVVDRQTGLMWVKNGWRLDFLSAVDWWDAKKRCDQFRLQGYSDWRLPTVEEWESLIDPNQEHPALVSPHPFKNIIAHMPYWTATDFYLPSGRKARSGRAVRAYTILMYYGTVSHQRKRELGFVLPVRSIR